MNQKKAEFIAHRVIRGNILAEEITETLPALRAYLYNGCVYVESTYRNDDGEIDIHVDTDANFDYKDLWEYFYWKWEKGIALKEFDSKGKTYDPHERINNKILKIIT